PASSSAAVAVKPAARPRPELGNGFLNILFLSSREIAGRATPTGTRLKSPACPRQGLHWAYVGIGGKSAGAGDRDEARHIGPGAGGTRRSPVRGARALRRRRALFGLREPSHADRPALHAAGLRPRPRQPVAGDARRTLRARGLPLPDDGPARPRARPHHDPPRRAVPGRARPPRLHRGPRPRGARPRRSGRRLGPARPRGDPSAARGTGLPRPLRRALG